MTFATPLQPVQKPAPMAKPCPGLLVIAQQPITTRALLEIFQPDHEVIIAGNGDQAFEICRSSLPDLILIDAVSPDAEELEVCRRLKDDHDLKDIPVILLIPQENLEAATNALMAGAADFITKPIHPAIARSRVNTHLMLKAQSDLLQSLALVDGLTGVASRRRFDEAIEAEWRRCRRLITPLALFMIDIDHFKNFNDCYGHPAGDICLQEVAAILNGLIGRSHDILARYDGGKFACVLPDIYFDGAMQKAAAMVQTVRTRALPHAASQTAPVVTISIGVVVTIPGPDRQPHEAVSIVKAQLDEARQKGRNRACGKELPGYFSNTLTG